MRPRLISGFLMSLAGLASFSWAQGPTQSWSPSRPAWPALIENHEPDLCAQLLRSSEIWFASDSTGFQQIDTQTFGLAPIDFGAEGKWHDVESMRKHIDVDGDGREETVLITRSFFRDEDYYGALIAASDAALDAEPSAGSLPPAKALPMGVTSFFPLAGDFYRYWYADPRQLFRWRSRYYFPGSLKNSTQAGAALFRLEASGATSVVCQVASKDAATLADRMQQSREIGALLAALRAIGTSGRIDCGSMHAGYRQDLSAEEAVVRAAVRPWAGAAGTSGREYSVLTWRFLENWAAKDPWNAREYLTLLQAVEPARRAYAKYLTDQFGLGESAARAKGDAALEALIASRFVIPSYLESGETTEYVSPKLSKQRISLDPKAANRFSKTSLMMAAHMNRVDLVRELLSRGADPEATTVELANCDYFIEHTRTALFYAAENASPLVMKVLVDAGANPKAVDGRGLSIQEYLYLNPRLSESERTLPIAELAAGAADLAAAPGFDCARAHSRAERAICASEALRLLDAEMSRAYSRATARLGATLTRDQKRWVEARGRLCAAETAEDYTQCLADSTAARERYLHYLMTDQTPARPSN